MTGHVRRREGGTGMSGSPPHASRALAWRPWFWERMDAGRERCRGCGLKASRRVAVLNEDGLEFGHILARALGGSEHPDNMTIVCRACNRVMGAKDWTGIFTPLTSERVWRAFQAADHEAHEALRHRNRALERARQPRGYRPRGGGRHRR